MEKPVNRLPQNAEIGLAAFNLGEFYEAHEHFEQAWREIPDSSREFYRALLQISAGFYRLTQGRPQAAKKFFTHALGWLQDFPRQYQGLCVSDLKTACQKIIRAIDQGIQAEKIIEENFHPIYPEEEQEM